MLPFTSTLASELSTSSAHIIIEEKHPAYYARIEKKMPSTIFTKISKITKDKYKEPIKWFEN